MSLLRGLHFDFDMTSNNLGFLTGLSHHGFTVVSLLLCLLAYNMTRPQCCCCLLLSSTVTYLKDFQHPNLAKRAD